MAGNASRVEFSRLVKCSAVLSVGDGGALPTAFRIFAAGVNDSTKGPALFDAKAAADVMSAYEREGNDLMIDREHDSLNPAVRVARGDASDAQGWFKLEVRDGELWGVAVSYTPEGSERLLSKKQRYISPAFEMDAKTGRVTSLWNVALVSMPATFGATALVAAGKKPGTTPICKRNSLMDPSLVKSALDALIAGDAAAALKILQEMIATAAGASPEAPEAPAAEALSETPGEPAPKPGDELKALAKTLADASKGQSELIVQLRSQVATLQSEHTDREATERKALVGDLVKLGVEIPATAWKDASKGIPCARLASEPLVELRARVDALRAALPERHEVETPIVTLSAYEENLIRNHTPEQRARYIALRTTRKAG
jgi:phage I-like protein